MCITSWPIHHEQGNRLFSSYLKQPLMYLKTVFMSPLSFLLSGINNSNLLNFFKMTLIQCSLYSCSSFLLSPHLSHIFAEKHCPRLCMLYSSWIFFRAEHSGRLHVLLIIFLLIHSSLMIIIFYCNNLTLLTCVQLMNSEEPICFFTRLPLNKVFSSQSCTVNYSHPRNHVRTFHVFLFNLILLFTDNFSSFAEM